VTTNVHGDNNVTTKRIRR